MPIVPQTPVPQTFGFEVADDINKNKSLLRQCTLALRANGIAVAEPVPFSSPNVGLNKAGTPYDIEKQWVLDIQSAMALTNASLNLDDGASVDLVKVSAKALGAPGNLITVTVAAGSVSGLKVTVTDGVTPEVYDDVVATATAVVAALAASLLVDAVKLTDGVPAIMATTNLAGGQGAAFTPPVFALGENDGQSIFIAKWAKALFEGLRSAGYIA